MMSNYNIPTPIIPKDSLHVNHVYEPAEDSFLFLDALEKDMEFIIHHSLMSPLCLEVGCGSGILSTALGQTAHFKDNVTMSFAVDLNPHACILSKETATLNCGPGKLETLQANGEKCSKLFKCKFDLILCNPPYVPTHHGASEVEQDESKSLVASWDGGQDGNNFITPFLEDIPNVLAENGLLYLLLSSWNNPEYLINQVIPKSGLKGEVVIKRAAGRERLSVWRICKV